MFVAALIVLIIAVLLVIAALFGGADATTIDLGAFNLERLRVARVLRGHGHAAAVRAEPRHVPQRRQTLGRPARGQEEGQRAEQQARRLQARRTSTTRTCTATDLRRRGPHRLRSRPDLCWLTTWGLLDRAGAAAGLELHRRTRQAHRRDDPDRDVPSVDLATPQAGTVSPRDGAGLLARVSAVLESAAAPARAARSAADCARRWPATTPTTPVAATVTVTSTPIIATARTVPAPASSVLDRVSADSRWSAPLEPGHSFTASAPGPRRPRPRPGTRPSDRTGPPDRHRAARP